MFGHKEKSMRQQLTEAMAQCRREIEILREAGGSGSIRSSDRPRELGRGTGFSWLCSSCNRARQRHGTRMGSKRDPNQADSVGDPIWPQPRHASGCIVGEHQPG